jgi:hypothetical protein
MDRQYNSQKKKDKRTKNYLKTHVLWKQKTEQEELTKTRGAPEVLVVSAQPVTPVVLLLTTHTSSDIEIVRFLNNTLDLR